MNRRSFLAALAAPAERVEADMVNMSIYKLIATQALPVLEANLFTARKINRAFEANRPIQGDSIQYRIPQRFLRSG